MLKGDASDPQKATWPKPTTGFDCVPQLISDVGASVVKTHTELIENAR